jgi:hypothetical protein
MIVAKKRIAYMTPEWKEALKYAIVLGDQLGDPHGCRGLPGLKRVGRAVSAPALQRMKKNVMSEALVVGGR